MIRRNISLLVFLLLVFPHARSESYIVRKISAPGIVWFAPREAVGNTPPSGSMEAWNITSSAAETMISRTFSDGIQPEVSIEIESLDTGTSLPRTRADQPFTVSLMVRNLPVGLQLPEEYSSLALERIATDHTSGRSTVVSRSIIERNGLSRIAIPVPLIPAENPAATRGEETFVVRSRHGSAPWVLAAATITVHPITSGTLAIVPGKRKISVATRDVYPGSTVRLLRFTGTGITGKSGVEIPIAPFVSIGKFPSGVHTLALVADTPFGRELLCDPLVISAPAGAAFQR